MYTNIYLTACVCVCVCRLVATSACCTGSIPAVAHHLLHVPGASRRAALPRHAPHAPHTLSRAACGKPVLYNVLYNVFSELCSNVFVFPRFSLFNILVYYCYWSGKIKIIGPYTNRRISILQSNINYIINV